MRFSQLGDFLKKLKLFFFNFLNGPHFEKTYITLMQNGNNVYCQVMLIPYLETMNIKPYSFRRYSGNTFRSHSLLAP